MFYDSLRIQQSQVFSDRHLALLEILMLLVVNWFKFCTLGTMTGCVLAQLDVCLDM